MEINNEIKIKGDLESYQLFKQPELSGWKCHLFGSRGEGITYFPAKGSVPNWFIRFMMKVTIGCTWIKED